jgi:hypothetical protein
MSVWEFVAGADWRLMTPEYVALTFGAFVVVALLIRRRLRIWKRMGTIEAGLSKMQSEIATILQVQSALITKLNATSKVEIDQRNTAIEMTSGDIAGQSMLRIPMKSPRHSEMMSPGVPTRCRPGPVPRWRMICATRFWDGQLLATWSELPVPCEGEWVGKPRASAPSGSAVASERLAGTRHRMGWK